MRDKTSDSGASITRVVVTAAVLRDGDRVFVARRGPGRREAGRWEFPGGKVEPGESPEACLARELDEELGIAVAVGAHVATSETIVGDRCIVLMAFEVVWIAGELRLVDHDAWRWERPESLALGGLDMPEPDLPIVAALCCVGR